MSKEKSRYFTFLIYPESVENDWVEKLELLGVPIAISPLHDKDLSKVEGQTYKKAHYHIIYIAKNPVTADSVRKKVKGTLGDKSVALVQIIQRSIENMYLYLTHESKDAVAKNKHKYDKKDIQLLNNFDIDRYVTIDVEEKEELFDVVCDLIEEYGIANMKELSRFIKRFGIYFGLKDMRTVRQVSSSKTGMLRLYFDAAYQARKNGIQDIKTILNPETGEIIGDE